MITESLDYSVFLTCQCRWGQSLFVIVLENQRSMEPHKPSVVKTTTFHLSNTSRIRISLEIDSTRLFVSSQVMSRIDACNNYLWVNVITSTLFSRFQTIQNCAARIVPRVRVTSLILTIFQIQDCFFLLIINHCMILLQTIQASSTFSMFQVSPSGRPHKTYWMSPRLSCSKLKTTPSQHVMQHYGMISLHRLQLLSQ